MSDPLKINRGGAVLRVTLNRPHRHNALSARLVEQLLTLLRDRSAFDEVSVVLFSGTGPSFCSGYDLSEGATQYDSPMEAVESVHAEVELFRLLREVPVPTIAQVQGNCLGAGTDLALACDLVTVSTDASVGYQVVRALGVPATHMWLFNMGPQWAKRLLWTGETISGATAAEAGFAVAAVDSERLAAYTADLAQGIADTPRATLVASKRVVNRGLALMGADQLQHDAATFSALLRQTDTAERFWSKVEHLGPGSAVTRDEPRPPDGRPDR